MLQAHTTVPTSGRSTESGPSNERSAYKRATYTWTALSRTYRIATTTTQNHSGRNNHAAKAASKNLQAILTGIVRAAIMTDTHATMTATPLRYFSNDGRTANRPPIENVTKGSRPVAPSGRATG